MEHKLMKLSLASNRRRSTQVLLLGVLLLTVLFSQVLPISPVKAAGDGTDVLLLSCMDYRLVNETETYMTGRGLRDKYDHVVLAGAALGALNDKYPGWGQTFADHLDVAIKLHHIHKVMILDHRDCGAYKVILGEDLSKDAAKETKVHAHQMNLLAEAIQHAHPDLEVELLLINVAGKVEPIALEHAGH